MNASPYRMARSSRDEMVMTLSGLGPDHPDAPAVQQKIKQYDSLMKNPEWKLQALEKRRVFVQGLPDDPFGEKKNNLAQIDKEISIVRNEAVAQTKRAHELDDIGTKHGQAKELKRLEISATDKRSALERESRLEAARIRAGASGDKFNKGEAEYQDEWAKNKIISSLGLQLDMNGNPTGQVTKQQLEAAQILGQRLGYEIQAVPGKAVDRPGWFTGDEPMFQIVGINRTNMPGRGSVPSGTTGLGGSPQKQPAPKLAADGNYYLPDPNRPGKYLIVQQDQAPGTAPAATVPKPVAPETALPQAPPAASPEAIGKSIGTLSSGVEFGKGDRGYVVNRNGEWTVPTPQELKEIQVYVQQNPQSGGTPVDINIPYVGPKGGYYNPANYKGLGR